jgi:hypothetical protein
MAKNTPGKTFISSNQDLRTGLAEIWDDLRSGKIKAREAKEFSNIAGKIISSAKLDIEYIRLCHTTPKAAKHQVKFLTTAI